MNIKHMNTSSINVNNTQRYALNTVQATVVHNFTEVGYTVLKLPPATFKWLKKWYQENLASEIVEGSAGAVGTQHAAPW